VPHEEAVVSEETGEPRRARERRTARGSQGAVAEELVPKNRWLHRSAAGERRSVLAKRYQTLPFSLGNESGSCGASKGADESSLSREFGTKPEFGEAGTEPDFVTSGEV
jgi:hypothetical protein